MPQLLILDKEQLQIQMAIEEMLTDTLQSRLSSVLELEVVLKVRFSMYNQPSIPIDRLGHNDMCRAALQLQQTRLRIVWQMWLYIVL